VKNFNSCVVNGDSSNCACDVGIGAWALSSARYPRVDFVTAFSDDDFRVVTRTSLVDDASSKFFFFRAFSWHVWVAILGLLITHVVVTSLDSKFAPLRGVSSYVEDRTWVRRMRRFLLKNRVLFRLRHALFNSMFHLVGQNVEADTHKSGTKEKIMNLLAITMGIFFITVFQASVTFQVLSNVPGSTFKSVQDFKACNIPDDRVCLQSSGAAITFWNNAIATSRYVPFVSHVSDSSKQCMRRTPPVADAQAASENAADQPVSECEIPGNSAARVQAQ
jgi:hypothetical protein